MKKITKNVRSERGNPTAGFLQDRYENVAVMKNQNGFFRKTVFTVVMFVWCGAMSYLSAQQICVGETYEVAVKIHYATTLKAEWLTGNEGTGTLSQPQLEEEGIWTWLYPTTPQDADKIIKVRLFTDFINEFCEPAEEIIAFTVTKCNSYRVCGTVFPFVHTRNQEFDNQYITTVKLYNMPPEEAADKIGYILKQKPIREEIVTYYDCTVDEPIIGAPKNPGVMGNTNNPGLPIRWETIGLTSPTEINDTPLTETENCPTSNIGKFFLENVLAGEYVIEISRPGFLTRYGVITVTGDMYSGHRELLGGDVNSDRKIDDKDISVIRTKTGTYGIIGFEPKYDLTGDGSVDGSDINIMRFNINAYSTIYQETADFVNP